MNCVADEIERAREVLRLPAEQIRELPNEESSILYHDLLDTFVEGGERLWWWEAFKSPEFSIDFRDENGFEHILPLVPDPNERIWFLIGGGHFPFRPIYETTPTIAVSIIGECYGFEYYLVSKSRDWILCENHHGTIVGAGSQFDDIKSI